jgi:hypothetical protein
LKGLPSFFDMSYPIPGVLEYSRWESVFVIVVTSNIITKTV